MIDTIKIVSMINEKVYHSIKNNSIIKMAYNNGTKENIYTIINDHLKGSYNSSLSVKVGDGGKYGFQKMNYIEIEGSYHKLMKGYNSHHGYYHLQNIVIQLLKIVEQAYDIKLPKMKHWFLQRIDIAICYDLKNQGNVQTYIDNLSRCNYARRKLKHYEGESIYITGATTTIKIYNKLKEFEKNDLKKYKNTDFDLFSYQETIKGFIRFECEIKKRKLKNLYKKKYVRIDQVVYQELREIWKIEFEKFLKSIDNELLIVREKEQVKQRLYQIYTKKRAKHLFDFYLLLLLRGISELRKDTDKSSYYKNMSDLKKAKIDFSQKIDLNKENRFIHFNPFEETEIR
jgi:II/X family phage/plasmid replication protein